LAVVRSYHIIGCSGGQSTSAVQWIPSHCGLHGNKEAGEMARLAKDALQFNLHTNCISYCGAKGMIKDIYKRQWTEKHNPPLGDDWPNLTRREQTTILRIRTGHNRLLHLQHGIGLSHTPECPCGTGLPNAEHILQWCPLHREARNLAWPHGTTMEEKLWGPKYKIYF
jgi:hypothetical protein